MILIALGANLPSKAGGPRETLEAALRRFEEEGVRVAARSRWFETAPVPVSDQPWFVNGVVAVETTLDPLALLELLRRIEAEFGRQRTVPNAARSLDLDLVDYDARVLETPELVLPHPRMQDRAFVLLPLADVAPGWHHPILRRSLAELIAALPPEQRAGPVTS
jgi:2-amino-4-hydroxy-6-hydroxymethyldihydropteridine diphosphokinase